MAAALVERGSTLGRIGNCQSSPAVRQMASAGRKRSVAACLSRNPGADALMIRDRSLILPKRASSNDTAAARQLRNQEWLVTNGLGGYASSTLAGIPARRYHGLFVPNLA